MGWLVAILVALILLDVLRARRIRRLNEARRRRIQAEMQRAEEHDERYARNHLRPRSGQVSIRPSGPWKGKP